MLTRKISQEIPSKAIYPIALHVHVTQWICTNGSELATSWQQFKREREEARARSVQGELVESVSARETQGAQASLLLESGAQS